MDKLRVLVWRPRTTIILILGMVIILVGLVISYSLTTFQPTTQVHIGAGVYALRLADTESELVHGLSDVDKLRPDGGLLMDFGTDGYHGIWMKDMNFPLDIVWLDKNNKVVYIVKNAPPEDPVQTVYAPKDLAYYVLELPAGSVQKAGIKTGMIAEFNIDV